MGNTKNTYEEPLKREREFMFNRFLVFRNLGPSRTLKKAYNTIIENPKLSQKCRADKKFTFEAIKKNSQNWQWVARAELFDANNLLKQQTENEEKYKETTNELINQMNTIVKFLNNILNNIFQGPTKVDGTPYALPTVIKMIKDVVDILKVCNEQIRLCCGYSTTNNDVNFNNPIEIEAEVIDVTPLNERLAKYENYFTAIEAEAESSDSADNM